MGVFGSLVANVIKGLYMTVCWIMKNKKYLNQVYGSYYRMFCKECMDREDMYIDMGIWSFQTCAHPQCSNRDTGFISTKGQYSGYICLNHEDDVVTELRCGVCQKIIF